MCKKCHKTRVTYAPTGLAAPQPFYEWLGLLREGGRVEGQRELDSLSDRPNNSRHGRAMLWTDSYTRSLAPTSVPESTPAGLTITSACKMAQSERRDGSGRKGEEEGGRGRFM